MLPDFVLPLKAGTQQTHLLLRDVPAAVFFCGYPALHPRHDGYMRAHRDWINALLSRAIVIPNTTTPELMERLGEARDELERRYLAAVGWRPQVGTAPLVEAFHAGPAPPAPASWAACFARPPGDDLLGAVLSLARAFRVPPAQVWLWPISEYLLTQAIVLGEQTRNAPAGLPPSVYDIGLEGDD